MNNLNVKKQSISIINLNLNETNNIISGWGCLARGNPAFYEECKSPISIYSGLRPLDHKTVTKNSF